MPALPPLIRSLLLLAAGAVATLGFAPFNLPVATLISVVLGFYLLESGRGTQRDRPFRAGWLYGSGFFGAGVSWVFVSIYEHSQTPLIGAIGLTLLFVVSLGLLFALQFWLYRRCFKTESALGFAALWMLFEWLRSWLFTGFPWLLLGYAWIDTPLARLAPIGGVWLVSSAVLLSAAFITLALRQRTPKYLAAPLLIFASAYLLPTQWTQSSPEPIQIALMQPNLAQQQKWDPDHYRQHLGLLKTLSREAQSAQWIIWPETAIPRLIDQAIYDLTDFLAELEAQGQTLISGFPMRSVDHDLQVWQYQNALGVLTQPTNLYQKQRLVPFGEYLPFEAQLRGLIDFFNLPMSSFSLPREAQQPLLVGSTRISAAICYEIAYPELVSELAAASDLMLTVSNDTWFGGSHGPDQHLQIARMRALENGRWLIRGTNNGLTAVMDPNGELVAQLPREQRGVLNAEVFTTEGLTPYQRFGLWPAALINFALLLLALGASVRNRRNLTLK